MMRYLQHAITLAGLLLLPACGSARAPLAVSAADAAIVPMLRGGLPLARGASPIRHVVIIIQENRSFDNLFQGYPGADTAASGLDSKGRTIRLRPVSLATQVIIDHSATAFLAACDAPSVGAPCRNDGFDRESATGGPHDPQYAYVPHTESKRYFQMAHQYVVGDRMFTSQLDESFVAHQYIIAAQASHSVDLPFSGYWGCDGKGKDVKTLNPDRTYGPTERACFEHTTLGDELDAAGLSWRFYSSAIDTSGGEWSGYQAIKHIRYGPDWAKDVITPPSQFFTDVRNGTLANVTWITPLCVNSDHPACQGKSGPDWVGSLVNAVGESPYWNSTAIFVLWDDWGGLYDHVPPPFEDYDGLGFRVPLLIISPYAKRNYVSHVQYETGSILRFTEDQFGLARLAASDRRSNSPERDAFQFHRAPRAFVPFAVAFPEQYFEQQIDHRLPDDQ